MFDLSYGGGPQCVLLTSGSIDVAERHLVARCEYEAAFWLRDGSTVYVPKHCHRRKGRTERTTLSANKAQRWLGQPGYVIALLDPTDLQRVRSPTLDILMEAADYGARVFLATPAMSRIPRPLRWLSSLTFHCQSPFAAGTCIRGLLTLSDGSCVPNYSFKDMVELFGHGASVAVGCDFDMDVEAAINGAIQQVDAVGAVDTQMLVIEAPRHLTWGAAIDAAGEFDGPCVLNMIGTRALTLATCLRKLT